MAAVIAIVVPIVSLTFLVIAGIVAIVQKTRAAVATVDPDDFRPELTPIHRLVTPPLAAPLDDLRRALAGITDVTVDRVANGSLFAKTSVASGLFFRLTAGVHEGRTVVTIEGRRKIAHEGLSTADEAMLTFERALRRELVAMGRSIATAPAGVRAVAGAPPPPTASPSAATPTPAANVAPAPTESAAPSLLPPPVVSGGPTIELVFDDGTTKAGVTTAVVGRSPARPDAHADAVLVPIDDQATMSVSKTHFAIGVDQEGVWVKDLHSTNGLTVDESDGGTLRILPGRQARIMRGSTIHFGDRTCRCR